MKLPDFLQKHPVELILILTSSIITTTSYLLFLRSDSSLSNSEVLAADSTLSNDNKEINSSNVFFIDVSGAVLKPDLYEVTPGARLKDVIDLAGGLSSEADSFFVGRNFNMAKILHDQEKIYVPFVSDIANGTFIEETKVLDYLNPLDNTELPDSKTLQHTQSQKGILISINSANTEELDSLPGIGPSTAKKIIDNRPYSMVDELLSKKAVNLSTFEKIKEFIQL